MAAKRLAAVVPQRLKRTLRPARSARSAADRILSRAAVTFGPGTIGGSSGPLEKNALVKITNGPFKGRLGRVDSFAFLVRVEIDGHLYEIGAGALQVVKAAPKKPQPSGPAPSPSPKK